MPEDLAHLKAVDLREVWPNETADFTLWLADEENLDILANTLGLELGFEAKEISVGDFRADILCRNLVDDSRVLIENQLAQTDHTHLGQILTYAPGLNAATIIWIAEKFREEHRAALDWQNEITEPRFQFFGLEIELWKIGDSPPAPKFNIVSRPNDWSRTLSRDVQRTSSEDLSKTQLLQKKFWDKFFEHLAGMQSSIPPRKPQSSARMYFSIGKSRCSMCATLPNSSKQSNRKIRVEIIIGGEDANAYFHLLKNQREEIEKEIGELKWKQNAGLKSSSITLYGNDTDLTNEADWPNQHKWLASKLELLDKVFRPRFRALNAADWEPPKYEDDE